MAEPEIEVEKIADDRYRLRFRGNLMHVDSQALLDIATWVKAHRRELLAPQEEELVQKLLAANPAMRRTKAVKEARSYLDLTEKH